MSGNKQIGFLIVSFLIFALLFQCVKIIPEGRTGVVFNLSGGVQKRALGEGLHLLMPFAQSLIVFDTRILSYAFTNDDTKAFKLGDPIIAKTRDGQIVGIELSLVTQMVKSKAPIVYQKLRTDYTPVLKTKAGQILQEVIARHVADALYTKEARLAVSEEAKKYLQESFDKAGFKLYDVLLGKIDFSKEYIDAIENKQIAQQKAELSKIRKEIALKEKDISIIKGEAESQEVAIKGSAIQANPKVTELEYLETIEASKLDIPVIIGLKGNAFINLDKVLEGK